MLNTRDFRSDSVDSEVLEELSKTKATIIDLRRVPGVDKLGGLFFVGRKLQVLQFVNAVMSFTVLSMFRGYI